MIASSAAATAVGLLAAVGTVSVPLASAFVAPSAVSNSLRGAGGVAGMRRAAVKAPPAAAGTGSRAPMRMSTDLFGESPLRLSCGISYYAAPWTTGCLRSTKLCWVGKHKYIMNQTNSPTQGQPKPRKNRLKVAFGPLFPAANIGHGLGLVLYRKQTTTNLTQPNSPPTP